MSKKKPIQAKSDAPLMVDLRTVNLGMDNMGNIILGVEEMDGEALVISETQAVDFTPKFNAMMQFILSVHKKKAEEIAKSLKTKPKILGLDGRTLN